MKQRTALALIAAVAVALIGSHGSASAANSTPAIEAFNAAFDRVNDFTYKLHSHETKGSDVQDRVYDYSFMKPHYAKTLIESGANAGSGGVWVGGDQVSGHQGGILSHFHLKVSVHDPRATSLRGYTIADGLPQNIIANYASTKGELKQSPGGKVDGQETDLLDLKVADPASNGGISEQKIYLSQDTHWPLRQILYAGDQVVLDQSFTDFKTNTGLTQNDFPF